MSRSASSASDASDKEQCLAKIKENENENDKGASAGAGTKSTKSTKSECPISKKIKKISSAASLSADLNDGLNAALSFWKNITPSSMSAAGDTAPSQPGQRSQMLKEGDAKFLRLDNDEVVTRAWYGDPAHLFDPVQHAEAHCV